MVNFYKQAITQSCHQGLAYLRHYDFIHDFYLAGGTALALQIGHRISTDLDWFTTNRLLPKSERDEICQALAPNDPFEVVSEKDTMLFTRVFGTDVSFIHQHHALLEPTIEYNGIKLASPTDIGLMKLAAVNSRGTRRDFVDIYCLQELVSLDQLLELVPKKYADRPSFLAITARALTYFKDAEQQEMPRMLRAVDWSDVKKYSETAAKRLVTRYSGI